MKNKAQMDQVFVWVVVALVIGGVAFVGVKAIGGLLGDKCSVDAIRFQDAMRETISLNNDYGSINMEQISAPCDYDIICLVDARYIEDKNLDYDENGEIKNYLLEKSELYLDQADVDAIIVNSVQEHVQQNIFLVGKKILPAGYVSQIHLSKDSSIPPLLCIRARAGKFELELEGLGRNTLVKSLERESAS